MQTEDHRRQLRRMGVGVLSIVFTIAIQAPLLAQVWFGPEPQRSASLPPDVPIATSFDSADFHFAMPTWNKTTDRTSTCQCGSGTDCPCGMCDVCCLCNRGWRGWFSHSVRAWEGSSEIGLNGSSGNASNSNLSIHWDGARRYQQGELSFDFDYFLQQAENVVTMDRAVALGRYEREIGETGFDWYVQGFFEYDDLRAYPGRLAVNGGLSKRWIETDRFQLTGRAGMGASKKIDAPDDDWRPELQFGADYEYRLTDRQKVFGYLDYFPDLTSFSTYRLNYKVAWEGLLEDDWGLAIRASLMNWYDSDPGPGTRANDLYYMLSLVWGY
jgi:putative salt-induced outer membrane protein YdiY